MPATWFTDCAVSWLVLCAAKSKCGLDDTLDKDVSHAEKDDKRSATSEDHKRCAARGNLPML